MEALEDTVAHLGRLIAYPTISSDSNMAMIADLADHLERVGGRVEVMADPGGTKANLIASFGPQEPGGVLLSGHSDVVPVAEQPWTSDPFVMEERDGRLFGRGACDMKGFIAAMMTMAQRLDGSSLRRPLRFAITHDEEVGCLGARALIPELRARGIAPDIAVIGEPTEMRVIEGHKGCCEYTVRFSGLEGHGSAPDKGVNAVEYATRYVAHLMGLRGELMLRAPHDSPFVPPWTTINIGALHGGVAHNVIASRAELEWEMRPIQTSDGDFVRSAMAGFVEEDLLPMMQAIHPGARIDTAVIGEIPGFEVMAENAARDLLARLTGANGADVVAFGTEAGLFQSLGTSVAVCGPGSIEQAHKADEFVSLDQLSACLAMLDGLTATLCAPA